MSDAVSIDQAVLDRLVSLAAQHGDDPSHFLALLLDATTAAPVQATPAEQPTLEQPATEPTDPAI